ncbi:hypothetical protein [Streptomyces sp. NPDC059649]|uniref:hypothetical protein n=1 Tax=Streptomyces sp. NPDC059649 TaxID=3346895 RepID=UPI00369D02A2
MERLLRNLAEWLDATAPLAGPTPTIATVDVGDFPRTRMTAHLMAPAQVDRLSELLAVDAAVLAANRASKSGS